MTHKNARGCFAVIKYLLFAFNLLFWFMGCCLIGIGGWILLDKDAKQIIQTEGFAYVSYASITLLIIGGIIMLVGFFGCCGAIRESQCLLITFSATLFVLLSVLLGVGIWMLVSKDTLLTKAMKVFKKATERYFDEPALVTNQFVDFVQSTLQCCGAEDITAEFKNKIPQSCQLGSDYHGKITCNDILRTFLDINSTRVTLLAFGVGATLILGIVFSILLCCNVRRTQTTSKSETALIETAENP